MPNRCAAFGCNNNSKDHPQLSFHLFPKDKKLSKCWEGKINRKNWKPSSTSRICSAHFNSSCYTLESSNSFRSEIQCNSKVRRVLKPISVPTNFASIGNTILKNGSNSSTTERSAYRKRRHIEVGC